MSNGYQPGESLRLYQEQLGPEGRSEVARQGGLAAQQSGHAYRWTAKTAKAAAHKAGEVHHRKALERARARALEIIADEEKQREGVRP